MSLFHRAPGSDIEPNDLRINESTEPGLVDVIERRIARRDWLRGTLAAGIATTAAATGLAQEPTLAPTGPEPAPQLIDLSPSSVAPAKETLPSPTNPSTLTFTEIQHGLNQTIEVAQGYQANTVISWGDSLVPGLPDFDAEQQSAKNQEQQFGYNNDFIAYMPLPRGSQNSDHGLLCVNHEYTIAYLMFPGIKDKFDAVKKLTKEQVDIELAAHGHCVVEVKKSKGYWLAYTQSDYNRRLTATTPMNISGPAAGHERLKTKADPTGTVVLGTLNNCAGGVTPWGTVLTAEENFDTCFAGKLAQCGDEKIAKRERLNYARLGISGTTDYAWSRFYERFEIEKEPHEPNRFGWIVEYDPYDPQSVPVKRTALGRFKHEGATVTVSHNGHVVVYTGDDSRGEYLYRFVTTGKYDPNNLAANKNLLDEGTLSVAKFNEDGTLRWLPLVHGLPNLGPDRGFHSQADIVIEARRAADAVQATPLDRPEDIEVHQRDGRVYVMLTNNSDRKAANCVNPRPKNIHGQILELQVPTVADQGFDHTADVMTWDLLLLAGNPQADEGAKYHPQTTENGWLTCPDNCSIDPDGRLWIATDGAPKVTKNKLADGIYATDTTGPGRALTRMFFRAPTGAEVTGTCFTPDGTTLFTSIQHPGDEEVAGVRSTYDTPSTRWPDFKPNQPPRPSVVAIRRQDGGKIGS
jgi:uncharacterized protein